jgi:hypothetical protein
VADIGRSLGLPHCRTALFAIIVRHEARLKRELAKKIAPQLRL